MESDVIVTVLYAALSIVVGVLVRVVTVPVLLALADDAVCTAVVLAQLKQYKVPTVRSPLANVTVWLVTLLAVAMLGHAVPPAGQLVFVVLTVNVPAAPSV
jgi:hypothetical protein